MPGLNCVRPWDCRCLEKDAPCGIDPKGIVDTTVDPVNRPTHTDLMIPPEDIAAMDFNDLP